MRREERALQPHDETGDRFHPAPVRQRRRTRKGEPGTLARQYQAETRRRRAAAFLLIAGTLTACLLFFLGPGTQPTPQTAQTSNARSQPDWLQQPGVREAVLRALQGRTGSLPESGGAVVHDGTTGQKLDLKTPGVD